jgi:hypothetical protein
MKKDLYASLLNESEKKGISFNSLINGITKNYNTWDKFGDDIGFIPLSNIAISHIFDLLDEKNIIRIARYTGETIPKEMALLSHIGDDFEKIAELFETVSRKFGTTIVIKKNNGYSYTIRHKVNSNFSLYVSEFFLAMGKSFNLCTSIELMIKNTIMVNLEDKLVEFGTISKRLKTK